MKLRILSLIALLFISLPSAMARLGTVDGIAIVINNDIITLSDWQRELDLAKQEMAYLPPNQRMSGTALEDHVARVLITSRFQDQFAKQLGLYVQNNEVDAAIMEIAARNGTDVATLKEYIAYQGMDFNQYRENIRGQMLASRLQNQVVQGNNITEKELDLYMKTAEFKRLKEEMMRADVPQHKVSHILVAVNKDKSEAKALQEANRLRDRIISGDGTFEDIARANSQDPFSAAQDGDLGWVGLGQLAPSFEKTMMTLPVGEISQPVRTPYGYHLIKVEERRKGFQDDETIRNVAREFYFRKKAGDTFDEWLNRMLSDVHIEKRVGTPTKN
ncbi:peptidylprolyl isomerase [Ignatzschineria cameli]|uniref:peptidylprolyl isomerase n=1 Tax=Ignatzschineria cameli TaxID=2182793 RepID=UPI000D6044E0|nr:peptidylprolyl isomerase [Ignatzschineria cameli]PWD85195.1 hypothetical protein DC080_05890 [Ignatzschineria cameli]